MKTLFAAALVLAACPVAAGTVTIGNSLARDCYQATIVRDHDRNAFSHCDLALQQEALSDADRAATLNARFTSEARWPRGSLVRVELPPSAARR